MILKNIINNTKKIINYKKIICQYHTWKEKKEKLVEALSLTLLNHQKELIEMIRMPLREVL